MKRLQKLIRLNRYIESLRIPNRPDIEPIRVVEQGDATTRLTNASGDQVLIARPECVQRGGTDNPMDEIAMAFFCLAKINSQSWTQELSDETYDRLLEIANDLLKRLCDDLTGSCTLLSGLSLEGVNIIPEYSIFGSWSGWSVEITFRQ